MLNMDVSEVNSFQLVTDVEKSKCVIMPFDRIAPNRVTSHESIILSPVNSIFSLLRYFSSGSWLSEYKKTYKDQIHSSSNSKLCL